jgi:hypothetical protein
MATGSGNSRGYGSSPRQSCTTESCFATFESAAAREDDVRHCNRSGPDGGHANRWDGEQWQTVSGRMQHDRTS